MDSLPQYKNPKHKVEWNRGKLFYLLQNKEQKIYLYCGSGYRSLLAGANLQKMGYTNVYSMAGGIKEGWLANGYPIVQG